MSFPRFKRCTLCRCFVNVNNCCTHKKIPDLGILCPDCVDIRYREAENQFALWGFSLGRLTNLLVRVQKVVYIMPGQVYLPFDMFIIWLRFRHGGSRTQLDNFINVLGSSDV